VGVVSTVKLVLEEMVVQDTKVLMGHIMEVVVVVEELIQQQ
jgi:hypothetical protein